jgi:hypothetical protein
MGLKEAIVQKMIWALVAMLAVLGLGTAPAYAGATCKIVPSLCPPPPNGGGGSHPVPEPASLSLLAAGAAAAEIARRRRNKKK